MRRPNWIDRAWLHWVLTTPKAAELQFVFGSQNLTRLKMLPPMASNRIVALRVSANVLEMFRSSL